MAHTRFHHRISTPSEAKEERVSAYRGVCLLSAMEVPDYGRCLSMVFLSQECQVQVWVEFVEGAWLKTPQLGLVLFIFHEG